VRPAGRSTANLALLPAKDEDEPEQRDVPEPGIGSDSWRPGAGAGRDRGRPVYLPAPAAHVDVIDQSGKTVGSTFASAQAPASAIVVTLPAPDHPWWTGDRVMVFDPRTCLPLTRSGPRLVCPGGPGTLMAGKLLVPVPDGMPSAIRHPASANTPVGAAPALQTRQCPRRGGSHLLEAARQHPLRAGADYAVDAERPASALPDFQCLSSALANSGRRPRPCILALRANTDEPTRWLRRNAPVRGIGGASTQVVTISDGSSSTSLVCVVARGRTRASAAPTPSPQAPGW